MTNIETMRTIPKAKKIPKAKIRKETAEINYEKAIDKMKGVLKVHSKRNLTLIGKVTIIKSLVIPQIVHFLSVLPSPNKSQTHEIYDILKSFIWEGKRSKLAWPRLTLSYDKGGLNLTDLESFYKSLKISWIKRIQASGAWQLLFE